MVIMIGEPGLTHFWWPSRATQTPFSPDFLRGDFERSIRANSVRPV
jgi:hypothetical protein